jgi:hypothetical protein
MLVENKFLFNFAASYSTGGYKRLYEYARWFNRNGGAWFVIHPRCADLIAEFPNSKFFVAKQSRVERLYNDCGYLNAIAKEIGRPELYYSYGIPLYFRFGKINWFHLSNVLPLGTKAIPLSVFERVKAGYLGRKIVRGFANADVISAESDCSLGMLGLDPSERLFLSVNGSDDELACLRSKRTANSQNIATVVGTAAYKALEDSFLVFEMLKKTSNGLKLAIIGNPGWIPRALKGKQDVVIRGLLQRSDVIDCLRSTKFYISTTCIENSYNAAAEGVFFADESYISDIGPHRELLVTMPFEEVSVPGVRTPLLHVRRDSLTGANLKSWETVIVQMIARFQEAIRSCSPSTPAMEWRR